MRQNTTNKSQKSAHLPVRYGIIFHLGSVAVLYFINTKYAQYLAENAYFNTFWTTPFHLKQDCYETRHYQQVSNNLSFNRKDVKWLLKQNAIVRCNTFILQMLSI